MNKRTGGKTKMMDAEKLKAIAEEQANQVTQTGTDGWIQKELDDIKKEREEMPTLKFEEGVQTSFEVVFEDPFKTWIDSANDTIKKILPVIHEKEKKNLWLNTKNPLYQQILEKGNEGQRQFTVVRSGQQKQTRYTLVEMKVN